MPVAGVARIALQVRGGSLRIARPFIVRLPATTAHFSLLRATKRIQNLLAAHAFGHVDECTLKMKEPSSPS